MREVTLRRSWWWTLLGVISEGRPSAGGFAYQCKVILQVWELTTQSVWQGDMTRCDMVTGMVFSLPHVGVPLLIGGSLLFGDLSAGCEYLESKYGY